jgi:hypothetical protein
MGQSVYLPAAVLILGFIAVLCFAAPTHAGVRSKKQQEPREAAPVGGN